MGILKIGMPNFSASLFDTTASLETHNRFDSPSSLSDPESPIQDIIPPPTHTHTAASSPIELEPRECSQGYLKPPPQTFDYELSVNKE